LHPSWRLVSTAIKGYCAVIATADPTAPNPTDRGLRTRTGPGAIAAAGRVRLGEEVRGPIGRTEGRGEGVGGSIAGEPRLL